MFGSDWPVCLLGARDYAAVFALVNDWAQPLGPTARAKLFGLNAARIYRIP
jgi:predicted TIM-barrel fold metal-dependent hydrolase